MPDVEIIFAALYRDFNIMYITNAKNDNATLSISSITFDSDVVTPL